MDEITLEGIGRGTCCILSALTQYDIVSIDFLLTLTLTVAMDCTVCVREDSGPSLQPRLYDDVPDPNPSSMFN